MKVRDEGVMVIRIRLINVPLEAWNVKGISAISSRLGRPIKIDQTTAEMCKEGSGRLGFARVLVEINAEKSFLDIVEINYVDGNNRKSGPEVVNDSGNDKKTYEEANKEGFVEVRNRKNYGDRRGMWNNNNLRNRQTSRKDGINLVNVRQAFVPKAQKPLTKETPVMDSHSSPKGTPSRNEANKEPKWDKIWKVTKENVNEIRKSANKYVVLSEDNDSRFDDPCFDKRWQAMERGGMEMSDEEDVFENYNQAVKSLIADDIEGNVGGEGEKLHICAVLETHLKIKGINGVCDRVFRNWKWVSNVGYISNSCRIVVGWNDNEIDVMIVHCSSQAMFCQVELKKLKTKIYISFIYASNSISERRYLWRNLMMQKEVVNGWPWILMGDFNVTLKIDEHSSGGSTMTSEIGEFRDAVNSLEIEDICSAGFHYTWTKSLKNPSNNILKKLDKIMMNEEFLNKFAKAHGIFLPYLISDHSPSMLTIPNAGINKKRSFRFANYIADKNDFLETVKGVWDKDIKGCYMYKVVQKLKQLKRPLNRLNWRNGNIIVKAEMLKAKLKTAQSILDGDPHNMEKRMDAIHLLNEYTSVANDELKLLHQKARIQWLKEGDKNTAYFHRILKTRKHNGRLSSLGDIVSLRLSEEDAAEMIREVNDKEIKEAVFDIDSNKAAGPDRYC
ncbi:RNA-directed DNA polymerase, eukaryota, reverse transcriptase zinc-binding domain protein [Tanacetum coccineum]|uniref:RNA-directed DNA polymerase, eukaryota, reverse transcriptase zinc-binding domain protein n=1 Tax=Tanacetum coccineum TaxID=301880 RepID=A0ABQ5GHD7_9ASTR